MATMAFQTTNEPETARPCILIADDQADVLEALRLLLKGQGYQTESVTSPAALLEALNRQKFDAVLMDLNYARDTTSGREGLDLLERFKGIDDVPPIVVMTGWATVGLAVETMQRGVGDFVEKPWANERLLEILRKQIEFGRERRESRRRTLEESRAQSEAILQLHRQERDIQDARAIQLGLLPAEIPQLLGYEIACAWQPARVVGGDYYDVLAFGEEVLGICIADVAGKGLPAAMLMSNLQAGVRGLASPSLSPEKLCDHLNSLVCRNIANDRFITLFYAQLDGAERRLSYVNAGHNPPIVMHRDGSHGFLREGGGVVGIFPTQKYALGTHELASRDRVLLYTDGVAEACNPDGEEFGEARILQLLKENRSASAKELQQIILEAAGEFCRGDWSDDATLVVMVVE
jgi:sigma-B regulation protein RsbU (phosphoserine phosphatase)